MSHHHLFVAGYFLRRLEQREKEEVDKTVQQNGSGTECYCVF